MLISILACLSVATRVISLFVLFVVLSPGETV
jgi:hypothetical protein